MTARVTGEAPLDHPVDIGFPNLSAWPTSPLTGSGVLELACVTFGHPAVGPVLFLFATSPGADLPDFAADGHASDSWRMPLSGSLHVGRQEYVRGQSRLQPGWQSYPSDNFAVGEDGGTMALLFGDRRGTAVRPAGKTAVGHTEPEASGLDRAIGMWADLDLDQDPPCPPSSMLTSRSATPLRRAAHTDFGVRDGWSRLSGSREALRLQLGDPAHGPLMWMLHCPPGAMATQPFAAPSEVIRIVVSGAAESESGGRDPGSVWIFPSDHQHPAAHAGTDGLDEILILGDRQAERAILG